MPAEYKRKRDWYLRKGYPLKEAKRKAAISWNLAHPNNPNPWAREKKRR